MPPSRANRPHAARARRHPRPPAEPFGRIAGRIALAQAVRAIDAARETHPARRARRALDPAESLRTTLADLDSSTRAPHAALDEVRRLTAESQHLLGERLADLENFDRRSTHLSQQLYDEALRMPHAPVRRRRPAASRAWCATSRARSARRCARKSSANRRRWTATFSTSSTRRSAICCATPSITASRRPPCAARAASRAEGTLTLEARHSAGTLLITVTDDGAGIDLDALRRVVVQQEARERGDGRAADRSRAARVPVPARLLDARSRSPTSPAAASASTRCRTWSRQVRGTVRVTQRSRPSARASQLQLPLTLSVIRSLLVEVGGEPYALPLAHVHAHAARAPRADDRTARRPSAFRVRRPAASVSSPRIRFCDAGAVRRRRRHASAGRDRRRRGDLRPGRRSLSRRAELVVQPLDPRLGKIRDIAAGALMEDGAPRADRRCRRHAALGRKARRAAASSSTRSTARAHASRRVSASACWWSTIR